jgi:multidrug resistance efflux pump
VPEVKGRVVDVAVKPNVALERDEPLSRIDPKPYQFVVDQKKRRLVRPRSARKVQGAALARTRDHDRQYELFEKKVIAATALDTAQRNLDAATQTVAAAEVVEVADLDADQKCE